MVFLFNIVKTQYKKRTILIKIDFFFCNLSEIIFSFTRDFIIFYSLYEKYAKSNKKHGYS